MRIILTSVLLLVGFNQIMARSLAWYGHNSNGENLWNDYDDDQFQISSQHYNNDFQTFMMDKETLVPSTNDNDDDGINDISVVFLGSVLPTSEESRANYKIIQPDNAEINKNYFQENDDVYNIDHNKEQIYKSKNWGKNIKFEFDFDDIFGTKEPTSSEENKRESEEENKSSEDTLTSFFEDFSNDEVKPRKNVDVEVIDLTKSSEEKKNDDDIDITEKDIKDLVYFFANLGDVISSANEIPENTDEVEHYLTLFSVVLDKVRKEEHNSKENKNNEDKQNNSDEMEDDENNFYTTQKAESDEEFSNNDENTPTVKYDSDENGEANNEDNDDDDKNNNTNASDSNENESNLISSVFHGLDDSDQQKNLDDYKYQILKTSQVFQPTSAPYNFDWLPTSTLVDQSSIHQYAEIRENLDNTQDSLQTQELALDGDFYNIIGGSYDDESMNKFEKDIYVVQENLDRIKRNINAMQNLQSKLYFHKLITTAFKYPQMPMSNDYQDAIYCH